MKRKIGLGVAAFLLVFTLSGCNLSEKAQEVVSEDAVQAQTETPVASVSWTDRELDDSYDVNTATKITLEGSAVTASTQEGLTIIGTTVTIKKAGTYLVSGTLDDGQVIVDVGENDKVQLVLKNASITKSGSAALYVKSGDKVFVTIDAESSNALINTGTFVNIDDSAIDSAVFSKTDLAFNGTGRLTVASEMGHAVVSKDDLTIANGTYVISSEAGHGLAAKDTLKIAGGMFTIEAAVDGIHASNNDDAALGSVFISGGTFDISAESDGIDVQNTVVVSGGVITLSVGDDGIHSDGLLQIEAGEVTIAKSYEGLEGAEILISGGIILVNASDDGLNARSGAEGNDPFAVDEGANLMISGGQLTVNANGDGLDSNGDLWVTGGTVYVSGPTSNGNGALDYNGVGAVTGGTVVAAGSSGMAENFDGSSTQGSILVMANGSQSGPISIQTASGETLLTFTPEKAYTSVVISTSVLKVGETYTIQLGTESQTLTLDTLIYGAGGMRGGQPGVFDPNGRPAPPEGRDKRVPPERSESASTETDADTGATK